jgi:hypothetical protein
MLERFDVAFQDASDELDLYGGFIARAGMLLVMTSATKCPCWPATFRRISGLWISPSFFANR